MKKPAAARAGAGGMLSTACPRRPLFLLAQNEWRTPRTNSLTERSVAVVRPAGTAAPMRPTNAPLGLLSFSKRVNDVYRLVRLEKSNS